MTFTGKDNIVCWSVIQYLNKETSELNDTFRSTDWGSGLAEAMCREVQHFPIPGGNGKLTLADLIVNTPRDQIAKVTLEEKVFETWYHGRTVLMGDGKFISHRHQSAIATLTFWPKTHSLTALTFFSLSDSVSQDQSCWRSR